MNILKPKAFADKIGVSVITLQRWDRSGVLPAKRTITGRRYYTEDDVKIYLGGKKNDNRTETL